MTDASLSPSWGQNDTKHTFELLVIVCWSDNTDAGRLVLVLCVVLWLHMYLELKHPPILVAVKLSITFLLKPKRQQD